ncbi:MAG: O-antigen ligase family protein [Candidatus Ratteibacteria bacterium]
MEKRTIPAPIKSSGSLWEKVVVLSILLFVMLRPVIDGIAYPGFNHFWNSLFFFITALFIAQRFRGKEITISMASGTFLLFLLAIVVSSFFSQVPYLAAERISSLLGMFVLLILSSEFFVSHQRKFLIMAIVAGVLIILPYTVHQSFWGLAQLRSMIAANPDLMAMLPPSYLDRLASNRAFATLVYPNILAGYFLLVYPILFFGIYSKNLLLRLFSTILTAGVIWGLWLTGSYGGLIICGAISVGMLLYCTLPEKLFPRIVFLTFFCGILLLIGTLYLHILPKMSSLADRFHYWMSGLSIFRKYPLVGSGPATFAFAYPQYKIPGAMEAKFAHNILIEILSETGIIGFSAFLLFVGLSLTEIWKKLLSSRSFLTAGFAFSLIAVGLHSCIDFDYADPSLSGLAFILLGTFFTTGKRPAIRLTKIGAGAMILVLCAGIAVEQGRAKTERILAYALQKQNQRISASAITAVRFLPDAELYGIRGSIFWKKYLAYGEKADAEKAVQEYKKASRLNPLSVKYHRTLALIYYRLGDMPSAEIYFSRVLALYPVKQLYNYEMALFYQETGRPELAERYFKLSEQMPGVTTEEQLTLEEYQHGKTF